MVKKAKTEKGQKRAIFYKNAVVKLCIQPNGDAQITVDDKVVWSRNINEYLE